MIFRSILMTNDYHVYIQNFMFNESVFEIFFFNSFISNQNYSDSIS
jgi:hypothetical protein